MSDSPISGAQLRYASISAFGLIVFSTIVSWAGLANQKYTPMKPDTSNATALANRSAFETFMDPSISSSSPFVKIIDLTLTPFQMVIEMLLMWANLWDIMGWASVFLIVPMLIMLTILLSVAVSLMEAALP